MTKHIREDQPAISPTPEIADTETRWGLREAIFALSAFVGVVLCIVLAQGGGAARHGAEVHAGPPVGSIPQTAAPQRRP
jgi:hypothetical protein